MTEGNSLLTTPMAPRTEADWPQPPRPVAQGFAAALATAFAAGPVTYVLGMGILIADGVLPYSMTAGGLALGTLYTSLFGLVGSGPAAILNTFVLGWLARRNRDHIGIAIGSGLALGTIVGMVVLILASTVAQASPMTLRKLVGGLWLALAFVAAGGLMGALHWRIAIRPHRRWRLFQEQARTQLRAME